MLSPATPLVSVILPACTIAYKSDQAIYHSQPILYVLMFGFIAAKLTNRLVVSRRSQGVEGREELFGPCSAVIKS